MPGNITLSGYPGAASTVLSTDLNGLTSNNVSALSAEQDNSTNKYLYTDVEVYLDTINVSSTTAEVRVYLVPCVDGANYPEFDTGTTSPGAHNNNYYVGTVRIKASNAAHRGVLRQVPLPPGKYKWAVRNVTGVALASTNSSTVKTRDYTDAYT